MEKIMKRNYGIRIIVLCLSTLRISDFSNYLFIGHFLGWQEHLVIL